MFFKILIYWLLYQKKILLIIDKKLNSDLVDFFLKNPFIWDEILIKDKNRKKGEIGSCCSSHALEQFVMHYDPKAVEPLFESGGGGVGVKKGPKKITFRLGFRHKLPGNT